MAALGKQLPEHLRTIAEMMAFRETWLLETDDFDNPYMMWNALMNLGRIFLVWRDGPGSYEEIPDDTLVPIPACVLRYFSELAFTIVGLAEGIDFRGGGEGELDCHEEAEAAELSDEAEEEDTDELSEEDDPPLLTPQAAISLIPAALGFSRPGWNGFAAVRAELDRRKTEEKLAELREDGLSRRAAYARLMEEKGLVDERSFRRRLRPKKRAKPPR